MPIANDANCELTTSDITKKLCGTDHRYKTIAAWGFCGTGDSHYAKMKRFFDRLISAGYPARFTPYAGGHSGWNTYYQPSSKIYAWVDSVATPPAAPEYIADTATLLYADPSGIVKVDTAALIIMDAERSAIKEYRLSNGEIILPNTRWVFIYRIHRLEIAPVGL